MASKAHVYSFTDQTLDGVWPEAGTPCMCKHRPRVSMRVRGLPHVAAIHHPTRSCNPSITAQLLFITIIKQRLLWLQKPVHRGLLLHEPAVVPGEGIVYMAHNDSHQVKTTNLYKQGASELSH